MNPVAGALLTATVRACLALSLCALAFGVPTAVAQTETPKPAPAHKAPKKAEKKQPEPPPQQAAPQAPPQQPAAAAPGLPPLIYSPWTKLCPPQSAGAPPAKQVCLIVKEARVETGQFVAGAAVIEQQGEEKKLVRITLPLGMQLASGTRLTLDSETPASATYVTCVPNGCMADYQVDTGYIDRMKKGQQLMLQAVSMQGQVTSFPIPLAEFGKAIDGPPTDPVEFGKRQQAEWEKRLKANPPPGAPPAAPPK
jgi:invasion protein IalB